MNKTTNQGVYIYIQLEGFIYQRAAMPRLSQILLEPTRPNKEYRARANSSVKEYKIRL